MPALRPLEDCRLYTFVDTGYLRGRRPEDIARALGDGGADLVQLRAKGEAPEVVQAMAERLLPIVEAAGAWFVVNDHPAIAAQVGAPLCHLGQEDFFEAGYTQVAEVTKGLAGRNSPGPSPRPSIPEPAASGGARRRRATPAVGDDEVRGDARSTGFMATGHGDQAGGNAPDPARAVGTGRKPLIGLSSHAPAQAERAIAAGAAYVAIGPVFATPTKPGRPAVTLDYVRWAAAHVRLPWFAIGGINVENLDPILEAGARRVCVVRAILDTPDVAQACREFARRLGSTPV